MVLFLRSGRAGDFLVARLLPGASNRHLPDTDEVVTVSSKEGLAISTPGKGQALRWVSPGGSGHLRPELLNHVLAFQARDRHWGGSALAVPGTSGLSSSTMFLLSRSQILMVGPVAAHSQYLLGLKVRALMVSAWSRV